MALGWDMDNATATPRRYKDVIHEDEINIGGAAKAPDYCSASAARGSSSSKPRNPPSS